jgi:hypothetical protein
MRRCSVSHPEAKTRIVLISVSEGALAALRRRIGNGTLTRVPKSDVARVRCLFFACPVQNRFPLSVELF